MATGLKNVREAQVGDTITSATRPAAKAVPGYQEAKSLVFAGIYPVSGEDYPLLRDAIEKLQYDLFYIKNLSITLDLFILFKTVKTVLMRKGAQ